jgi:hypothetical protein
MHPLIVAAFAPAVVHFAPLSHVRIAAMKVANPDRFSRAEAMARENLFDIFEAWALLETQALARSTDEARHDHDTPSNS